MGDRIYYGKHLLGKLSPLGPFILPKQSLKLHSLYFKGKVVTGRLAGWLSPLRHRDIELPVRARWWPWGAVRRVTGAPCL